MKNVTYKQNKQDRKFTNQVSHLSGFIGMPMWNGRNPTLSEIREFDRRVLEQQALEIEQQSFETARVYSQGFESKRQSSLNRFYAWLGGGVSKTFGKIAKTGITVGGKKAAVDSNPECC